MKVESILLNKIRVIGYKPNAHDKTQVRYRGIELLYSLVSRYGIGGTKRGVADKCLNFASQVLHTTTAKEHGCCSVARDLPVYRKVTDNAGQTVRHRFHGDDSEALGSQGRHHKDIRLGIVSFRMRLKPFEPNVDALGKPFQFFAVSTLPDYGQPRIRNPSQRFQ